MRAARIQSIDTLRALTMVLMIWVNDFWSLDGIPDWLQHMPADVDALGFSDVIFPAFLFIVGLSIPFAIQARRDKGDSDGRILWHIGVRTFALLVMGFFMVNLETYDATTAVIGKSAWQILMIVAFVLTWNAYRPSRVPLGVQRSLKTVGIAILVALAVVYRGQGTDGHTGMQPHWWGILGLIGRSYGICACVQLLVGRSLTAVAAAWLFFAGFNIAAFAGALAFLEPLKPWVSIVGDGSMPAMTMAGCFVATLYRERFADGRAGRFLAVLVALGVVTIAVGFALRPAWGISKILATPAWTEICTGIGILAFALFYWLADVRGLNTWPDILRPAGVATLTCYLVPYVAYPLLQWLPLELPAVLTTGIAGLLKSMVFAIAVVIVTGGLNKTGIRLKI